LAVAEAVVAPGKVAARQHGGVLVAELTAHRDRADNLDHLDPSWPT
jgi:hypothetical protein